MLSYLDSKPKAVVEEIFNSNERREKMRTILRSKIEAILSRANLELTPQRFAVLKHSIHSNGLLSEDEIILSFNRQYLRPSRATIFNTLQKLREAGIITKICLDNSVVHYKTNIENRNNVISKMLK